VLGLTNSPQISAPATDSDLNNIAMSSEIEQRDLTCGQDQCTAYTKTRSTVPGEPLSKDEINRLTRYFSATLYLCLGMLYLKGNPLLQESLKKEHLKPRLLGHWGSDAGQSFMYVQVQVIRPIEN
jgi:xylulose-5-phosphate/fructose-6-phosphate phosphoketolase